MDISTVSKLLEKAASTESPSEALSAVRLASRQLRNVNRTFGDLGIVEAKVFKPIERFSVRGSSSLQEKLDAAESEIERLTQELATVSKKLIRAESALAIAEQGNRSRLNRAEDGSITYKAFEAYAVLKIGGSSWRRVFSDQTKIKVGRLPIWEKNNKVPSDAVDIILATRLQPETEDKKPVGKTWTLREVRENDALLASGLTHKKAAEVLTSRFGRLITEGGSKRARQYSVLRAYVKAHYDNGIVESMRLFGLTFDQFPKGYHSNSLDGIVKIVRSLNGGDAEDSDTEI